MDKKLSFYTAVSRFGRSSYRSKILALAAAGIVVPLLAIVVTVA